MSVVPNPTVVKPFVKVKPVPVISMTASAPAGSEQSSNAQVVQGVLENSNVNPISAGVELVSLQRHAELLQQALTAFHTNFNRIAAQTLPQI